MRYLACLTKGISYVRTLGNMREYTFVNIIGFIHHALNMTAERLSNALLLFFGCLRCEWIQNVVSFLYVYVWIVRWTRHSLRLWSIYRFLILHILYVYVLFVPFPILLFSLSFSSHSGRVFPLLLFITSFLLSAQCISIELIESKNACLYV